MESKTISRFNAFLMFILILFWGSSFVVVKVALMEGLTPIAIATFRFLVAGGLFLVAILLEGMRVKGYVFFVEKKDFPMLVLLALTGVTFFFTAQYTGIKMAGASIAAIFVCLLAPVFITVLSAKLLKEHLVKRQFLGVGIAAIGTFIVIMGGSISLQTNHQFLLGSLILLSTPILWTAYSLLGKNVMEKYSPFLVVAYVNILGGLLLIPFSLADGSFSQIFTMHLNGWLAILFLAVTCSFLGYYIWFYVIKRVGAAIASSFLFAEPLITALFAVAFVREELNLFTVAGGFLIFIGVYLVTRK
ncbi:MAG: EamA family transporter [Candidatus Bathyarchaeota archaeon]|jgi:drug/metabolite transporter (DMT)-like permease|nr:EamA family transporter [Candidatus Bathyarchaeota archaeon]